MTHFVTLDSLCICVRGFCRQAPPTDMCHATRTVAGFTFVVPSITNRLTLHLVLLAARINVTALALLSWRTAFVIATFVLSWRTAFAIALLFLLADIVPRSVWLGLLSAASVPKPLVSRCEDHVEK